MRESTLRKKSRGGVDGNERLTAGSPSYSQVRE